MNKSLPQLNLLVAWLWILLGFLELAKQLYSAEETRTRRRNFKRMLRTPPNFGSHAAGVQQLLAA